MLPHGARALPLFPGHLVQLTRKLLVVRLWSALAMKLVMSAKGRFKR